MEYEFLTGLHMMKAGRYLVIDPCYPLQEMGSFWDDYCNHLEDNHFRLNGHLCFYFGTKFGDGVYDVEPKGTVGVDSGTIALIPIAALDTLEGRTDLGAYVTLERDATPTLGDGNLSLGSIRINTNWEEEDEEE